jgi:hypothetical protein
MKYTNKNIEEQKKAQCYDNVTCFELNGQKYYYNILTNEELEGEALKEYLEYINNDFDEIDALPF